MTRAATFIASIALFEIIGGFEQRTLAVPPSFNGIGDLPGGNNLSALYGVSADGSVVVGYSHSAFDATHNGDQALYWTIRGGLVPLGDLPSGGFQSVARAVSPDGTIIVGDSLAATGGHAFRWTQAHGMVDQGDLPGGDSFSIAYAISADGNTIAGHSSSANSGTLNVEGFRKVGSNPMAGIGDLAGAGFFSSAQGISADGTFIAGYGTSTASGPASSEAFRWSLATGCVGIGDLPGGGFGSNAFAISADGSVIVGLSAATAGVFAFRWTDPATGGNGIQSIGDLPGGSAFSRANSVSADGTVVVGQSIGATNSMEAFIWDTTNGMKSLKTMLVDELGLDLTGWTLEVATAVSADGRTIVGYGPHNGNYEGWVAFLGTPDIPGDITGDGIVDVDDLLEVINPWGKCADCAADLTGNGVVDVDDLLIVINNWTM